MLLQYLNKSTGADTFLKQLSQYRIKWEFLFMLYCQCGKVIPRNAVLYGKFRFCTRFFRVIQDNLVI